MNYIIKGFDPLLFTPDKASSKIQEYPFTVVTNTQTNKTYLGYQHTMDMFELVKLPENHGRLIDADELYKKIECVKNLLSDDASAYGYISGIGSYVQNAPTIVDAERTNDDS